MKSTIRKLLLTFLLGINALSLTACLPTQGIPYGVWKSDDPDMILYITTTSEETGMYHGEYVLDGQTVNFEFVIDPSHGGIMDIFYSDGAAHDDAFIFRGHVQTQGDRMVYTPYSTYQEKTGYTRIIFNKVADYDPDAPSSVAIEKPKKAQRAEKL